MQTQEPKAEVMVVEKKPIWKSKSIVAAFLAIVVQILSFYGIIPESIDPTLIENVTETGTEVIVGEAKLTDLFSLLMTAAAMWFRATATKVVKAPVAWWKRIFKKDQE